MGNSTPCKYKTVKDIEKPFGIYHARHLESHHVPTTQLRIEILHRIWYLDGKLAYMSR